MDSDEDKLPARSVGGVTDVFDDKGPQRGVGQFTAVATPRSPPPSGPSPMSTRQDPNDSGRSRGYLRWAALIGPSSVGTSFGCLPSVVVIRFAESWNLDASIAPGEELW